MTCKDCIHYAICPRWDYYADKPYEEGNSESCHDFDKFQDKSKCFELPCKVGDLIYCLSFENEHYELEFETILRMEILIGIYTTHMLIKTKKS